MSLWPGRRLHHNIAFQILRLCYIRFSSQRGVLEAFRSETSRRETRLHTSYRVHVCFYDEPPLPVICVSELLVDDTVYMLRIEGQRELC